MCSRQDGVGMRERPSDRAVCLASLFSPCPALRCVVFEVSTCIQMDGRTTAVGRLCTMNLYVQMDGRTTAFDQSYVRQPRFGPLDAAIWGGN